MPIKAAITIKRVPNKPQPPVDEYWKKIPSKIPRTSKESQVISMTNLWVIRLREPRSMKSTIIPKIASKIPIQFQSGIK